VEHENVEVENFVEIEESTFENLLNNYIIETEGQEKNKYELFISNLEEEDFEDFAQEVSAYHDMPNEYWNLLKHNWHTNRTIFIETYEL
jgi:hypothetical protein